jgi:S-methylmethionine-dependent homocysteine/selenocysteine methylase
VTALPQLAGTVVLTDGGLETTLIFVDGFDLPCFASFPLLERDDGREALRRWYGLHLDVARRHGTGFLLETPTWRANPAWGAELGYSDAGIDDANRRAVAFVQEVAAEWRSSVDPLVVAAQTGPQGDAYDASTVVDADAFAEQHSRQLRVLAAEGVELVSALTIASVEEGIGVVRAAAGASVPVALSFTVETDGRLPTGQPLGEALDQVEAETGGVAEYYMVNCAHPTHVAAGLDAPGPWERVLGVRANASQKSHAELDDTDELDAGDVGELAGSYTELRDRLDGLTVLGGCCGTDHRHLDSIAAAWLAPG